MCIIICVLLILINRNGMINGNVSNLELHWIMSGGFQWSFAISACRIRNCQDKMTDDLPAAQ